MPSPERRFLQFGAACSVALAVTTFLLWLLPQYVAPATTFEQQLALAQNPIHMTRLSVSLLHMLLGFAAYLAVYRVIRDRAPGFAALGLACFFIWAVIELLAVSINLFAVNATWRAGYAAANADTQALYRIYLGAWPGVWEGLYFLLASAYLLGSLLLGGIAATDPHRALTRVIGALLLLGGVISAAFIVSGYGGPEWPGDFAGAIYPFVQPAARLLTGFWLWKCANRSVPP